MLVHGIDEAARADLLSSSGRFVGFWWENKHDFKPLRYNGDLHQLLVEGTGGGKFTTVMTI